MKKIYISIYSVYSLDMTTSSTPPSFPPPLLRVLTTGRRAGAECWQGGSLERRRNCFVSIKGLCKLTAMNKSPLGPMSSSFSPLQQATAIPSVSDPQHSLLVAAWPLPCPMATLSAHLPGERAHRASAAPQSRIPLARGECRKPFLPPHTFKGLVNSRSQENNFLQTQGGGRMSTSPLSGAAILCDLMRSLNVITSWRPRVCFSFPEGEMFLKKKHHHI